MANSVTRIPANDARAVLHDHWVEDGRIRLPIDPMEIARSMGIKVHTRVLDVGTAGQLVKRAGQDPEIYLNLFDSEGRQRFTCAHEIGHYITHLTGDEVEWEYVDRRDAASSTGTRSQEIYANQFAAALLMPAHIVHKYAESLSPDRLAAKFGVSQDAMNYRLNNLGH